MDALIDRDVLFGNPDRLQTRISPDGRWLSWLAPVDGVKNVFVAPAEDPSAARAITDDRTRDIRMHLWSRSSSRVLYIQDAGGDENWHVYAANPDSGEVVDLTPGEGIQAQILHTSPDHPRTLVVGINDREPQLHDAWAVDVETGERELLYENPGFIRMFFDPALRPRLGVTMRPDGDVVVMRIDGEQPEPLLTIPAEDSLTTSPLLIDREDRLLLLDSRGRDTGAVARLDLGTGDIEFLYADDRADLADAWIHPETLQIQAAITDYTRRVTVVLDPTIEADVARLEAWNPGEVELVARTSDDTTWVVGWRQDAGPIRYATYDRSSGEVTFLWDHRPDLAGVPLTHQHPVVIEARDGLALVSYLSLPRWLDHDARPSTPLPMVLVVHGGPWARDSWGFDPLHQLLANRGYAVLSVNFRGSTGFGKAFVNAGDFEWAGKMHDDLLDAVQWAVDQGIADPARVAIMGGSYGGYATLVGLTFTPEVFAAGVDIVGPSNLVTLLETIPPYWKPMIAQFHTRLGTADTEEGREALMARSPLSRVDAIERPLLIGQGANDPRVKQAESDQIVQAMRARDIPVSYVLFPDEGHGFAKLENRMAFFALAESFLAEHLGGRMQPLGDLIEHSSAIVD